MIISILNLSNGKISDPELQCIIRAINRQVKEDFAPHWGMQATVRLEGRSTKASRRKNTPVDMRGDAIIYLCDDEIKKTDGYHDSNNRGIPFGIVYLEISKKLDEDWSVTLSHEVLELIADPEINLMVAGRHPNPKFRRRVLHDYEMCDAVQDESYQIDGVRVSNFVLPLYFTGGEEFEGRNDFLGTVNPDGSTLKSFGVNPGGYIGYFDPVINKYCTHDGKNKEAKRRLVIKSKIKKGRRLVRYQRHFKK